MFGKRKKPNELHPFCVYEVVAKPVYCNGNYVVIDGGMAGTNGNAFDFKAKLSVRKIILQITPPEDLLLKGGDTIMLDMNLVWEGDK